MCVVARCHHGVLAVSGDSGVLGCGQEAPLFQGGFCDPSSESWGTRLTAWAPGGAEPASGGVVETCWAWCTPRARPGGLAIPSLSCRSARPEDRALLTTPLFPPQVPRSLRTQRCRRPSVVGPRLSSLLVGSAGSSGGGGWGPGVAGEPDSTWRTWWGARRALWGCPGWGTVGGGGGAPRGGVFPGLVQGFSEEA